MDAAQRAALEELLASTSVRERFTAKLVVVPGSGCLWWTGAVSGRGHGRFWVAPGLVMVAHRVAYALALGVAALADAPLLAHGCDNPLCQHVGPGHVVASCAVLNRGEWLQRRYVIGSPVADPRGAGVRARALRDLARQSPAAVAAELDRHAASAGSRRRCGDASCCGSGRVGAAAAAARLVVRGGGGSLTDLASGLAAGPVPAAVAASAVRAGGARDPARG